jgi:osmotically-inducible protein OsmY
MKNTISKKLESVRVIGVITCISALPFLAATGCNRDNQGAPGSYSGSDTTVQVDRSAGEAVDDTAITSHVKKTLSDSPEYKFPDVKVTTMKGVVQLSGFVDTAAQKKAAADLAKQVPNTKEVVNNITLKK